MVKMSVIIVSYKSEQFIDDCIKSIIKYNDIGKDLEIIVIDNSPRLNFNILKNKMDQYFPVVQVYSSGGNIGFGAANNIGANLSKGKIILFLNPDTILIEPIFLKALDYFKDQRIATLGIQMVDERRHNQISFFFIRGYFTPLLNLGVKFLNRLNLKNKYMITSGACLFVNKNIFNRVGGFNSNMFLYHEESYLARKILNLSEGFKFGYLSSIKFIHLEKKATMSKFLLNEHYNSLFYFYKYFGYNLKIVKHLNLWLLNFKGYIAIILNLKNRYRQIEDERDVFINNSNNN